MEGNYYPNCQFCAHRKECVVVKKHKWEITKKTRGDLIRSMTDDELADELLDWFACFMAVEWSREDILDLLKQEAPDEDQN